MQNSRRFELRSGAETWAIVSVSDSRTILEHSLNETKVMSCPGLDLYDERNQLLSIKQEAQLSLNDPSGVRQLALDVDENGHITDIVDPAGKIGLVANFVGPGSAVDSPIRHGGWGWVLNVRWLGLVHRDTHN
jgi:hypothetical protein